MFIHIAIGIINPYKGMDAENYVVESDENGSVEYQGETGFLKEWIHFRAYINSFSDSYSGKWNSTQFMGRPESQYNYTGFDRKISLGFTVAAQSKPELLAQYRKLNMLASSTAPTFSEKGFMSGTLIKLTLGGWCNNLTGFIEGLTLNVPTESPWEIGIDDEGNKDPFISQLPHIVNVEGFTFRPIEEFIPQKLKRNEDYFSGYENAFITTSPANRDTDLLYSKARVELFPDSHQNPNNPNYISEDETGFVGEQTITSNNNID